MNDCRLEAQPAPFIGERAYDEIVAGLYRAATGDIRWHHALVPIRRALGATDPSRNANESAAIGPLLSLLSGQEYGSSVDPEVVFAEDWQRLDAGIRRVLDSQSAGADWNDSDGEAFRVQAVDQESQDGGPKAGATLHQRPDGAATASLRALSIFIVVLPLDRGPLSRPERDWVDRLRPHLIEALHAFARQRRLTAQAMAGMGLMEFSASPIWLIDHERRILHQTRAAADEAVEDRIVSARANRLMLRSSRADRTFVDRLLELAKAATGRRAVLDVRVRASDTPCWLHLATVEMQDAVGLFGSPRQVLATLFGMQWTRQLDSNTLADVFALTPAQARVAALMAEGMGAAEIAGRLGVKQPTVRSHVHQVLARLGARRSAEAVRLLSQGETLSSRRISGEAAGSQTAA